MEIRILLVDDELPVTLDLAPFLERCGFEVKVSHDGNEALRDADTFQPHLIVLDIDLPGFNGREVCRRLRNTGNQTPIIMLSKYDTPADHVLSLGEGADDYLNKPFEPVELAARIQAILRRVPVGTAHYLAKDELVLDRLSRRAVLAGEDLRLTALALRLLEYMMSHSEEALSRERLLRYVWGFTFVGSTRAVDIQIHKLRTALRDDATAPRYIQGLPGEGYLFIGPVRSAR